MTHLHPQTTNAVFLGSPPPLGYGFSQFGIAGGYATPIVRRRMLSCQAKVRRLTFVPGRCAYWRSPRPLLQRLGHELLYPAQQRCLHR